MDEIKERIVSQLHSVVAQCTPMDAHLLLSEIIEEAQSLQDECLKMEYAFEGGLDDDE